MIEFVDLPELTVIGVEVQASWQQLHFAMPDAWTRLFETETGASSFLEVSLAREGDFYRELVGYLAAQNTPVPEGLVKRVVPPGRYLRLAYDGPLSGIADGFGQLLTYAAANGLDATDLKLDFGYLPGLKSGRHELHVGLAEHPLRLA